VETDPDGDCGATHDEEPHPSWKPIPMEIAALLTMRSRIHVLTNVSCILDDQVLYGRMIEMAIGSTDATSGEYLVETVVDDSSSDDDDMSASDSDEEEDLDEQGLINLDEIIAGEQTSGYRKRFCQEIGATMRVLKKGHRWQTKPNYILG